jgi:hypothetical protein
MVAFIACPPSSLEPDQQANGKGDSEAAQYFFLIHRHPVALCVLNCVHVRPVATCFAVE